MPAPYSLDLRKRVVAAVEAGDTCRVVADRYSVSISSVVKWSQRARATGSAAAKPMGGTRRDRLRPERTWILNRIVEKPDLTLHALLSELKQRGMVVACDTLWRFLKREGLSFKKNSVCERTITARRCAAERALAQTSAQD